MNVSMVAACCRLNSYFVPGTTVQRRIFETTSDNSTSTAWHTAWDPVWARLRGTGFLERHSTSANPGMAGMEAKVDTEDMEDTAGMGVVDMVATGVVGLVGMGVGDSEVEDSVVADFEIAAIPLSAHGLLNN